MQANIIIKVIRKIQKIEEESNFRRDDRTYNKCNSQPENKNFIKLLLFTLKEFKLLFQIKLSNCMDKEGN